MLSKLVPGLLCLAVLFLVVSNVNAQYSPNSLNYQAVARDAEGKALNNKLLKVRLSILTSDPNGDIAWREEHNVTTNSLGLFTLNIGTGHKTDGYASGLNSIDWGKYAQFLKVEIDFGSGLMHMGTTQMMAVPYALYAEKAGSSKPDFSGFLFDSNSNTLKNEGTAVADLSPLKQTLEFDQSNYHLSLSGTPGIVDLRQFIHAPQDLRISNNKIWLTGNLDSTIVDLSPYKQSLSVNTNSRLEISNGNSVKVDTSNVNEIQTLSVSGNTVTLSKGGGEISIDASSSNEIQDLVKADNKLQLTKSDARPIPVDTSDTNEIQVLSKINDKLELSGSGGRLIPIDTSLNNEIQSLNKVDGKLVLISGTNSGRAVPVDTSLNNELQHLETNGTKLFLTDSDTEIDFDRSETNEILTSAEYNKSTKTITLNEGTNSKTINISSDIVAFRALYTSAEIMNSPKIIAFNQVLLNESNSYNHINGIFTVPINGAGLYHFYVNPFESLSGLTYEIYVDDQKELVNMYSQPFLYKLQEGQKVYIKAIMSVAKIIPNISFIGYKLN